MTINNTEELKIAVAEAGRLLQEIQDYCGSNEDSNAKVRFPRGYIRTATKARERFAFINDVDLKSNLSYTLMLCDTLRWVIDRTDITATAKEMLIKTTIFLAGAMIESMTKVFLKGKCSKNYKIRTEYLVKNSIITPGLKTDLDWVWDTRNNMHLFLVDGCEYNNEYNASSYKRCILSFRALVDSINTYNQSTLNT